LGVAATASTVVSIKEGGAKTTAVDEIVPVWDPAGAGRAAEGSTDAPAGKRGAVVLALLAVRRTGAKARAADQAFGALKRHGILNK
jgi:hypothetical protein